MLPPNISVAGDRDPDSLQPRHAGLVLALLVSLIFARSPILLVEPRMWIEEATVYFEYAFQHSFLEAVLLVPVAEGPAGYMNLAANIPAALAANLVPIDLAPWVSTFSALAILLLPFIIVIWGRSWLWTSPAHRCLACALLLLSPALGNGEIWLNSINSQVYCGVASVLLLFERGCRLSRCRRLATRVVLVFCGLSGSYTAFLTPAYIMRACIDRRRESRVQAILVALCAGIQAVFYFWTRIGFGLAPERFVFGRWAWRLTNATYHELLLPFLGHAAGPELAETLGLWRAVQNSTAPEDYLRLAAWTCAGLGAAALTSLWRRPVSVHHRLLPFAFICVAVLTTMSIADLPARSRYAAVPGTIMVLSAGAMLAHPARRRRVLAGFLVAAALVFGSFDYWREANEKLAPLGRSGGAPSWSAEVMRWRSDPGHRLAIWPYVGPRPLHVALAPASAFSHFGGGLIQEPVHLIAGAQNATRVFQVQPLPEDFRLILDVVSSQPPTTVDLRIELLDAAMRELRSVPLSDFEQESPSRLHLPSWRLKPLAKGRFSEVRSMRLELCSVDERPVRLTVEEIRVVPRVEGALEPLLPPYGKLATARLGQVDEPRLDARPANISVLALIAMAVIVAAARSSVPIRGRVSLWVVGLYFVAWPLSRGAAEIVDSLPLAALLFVPAAMWINGRLDSTSAHGVPLLVGAALGVAIVKLPATLALVAAILIHLVNLRRWRAVSVFVSGLLMACVVTFGRLESFAGGGATFEGIGDTVAALPLGAWRLLSGVESGPLAFPFAFLAIGLYLVASRHQKRDLLFAALLVLLGGVMLRLGNGDHGATISHLYPLFLLLVPTWDGRRTFVAVLVATLIAALPFLNSVGPAPWLNRNSSIAEAKEDVGGPAATPKIDDVGWRP